MGTQRDFGMNSPRSTTFVSELECQIGLLPFVNY
jgi:hypothetical protein